MKELKIGILVPRSRQYPRLSLCFIDGIRSGLSGIDDNLYNLFIEDIGIGASSSTVMDKCQKLMLQQQVDMVIAFVGNQVTPELRNLFHSYEKYLLITNMGENDIIHEFSPFVYYHSLGLWKACWEMGYYIATNIGKKVVVASSFYDSGYGLYSAFFDGLNAGNGTVERFLTSRDVPDEKDMQLLAQAVHDIKPDIVYGIFSGEFSTGFLNQYFGNEDLKNFPLAGSAFMLDDTIIENTKSIIKYEIMITTPFRHGTDSGKQGKYIPFFTLGNEISAMVSNAFFDGKDIIEDIGKIRKNFENIHIENQRGVIRMLPELHFTASPVYLTRYGEKGFSEISVLNNMPHPEMMANHSKIISGWINPYLCV